MKNRLKVARAGKTYRCQSTDHQRSRIRALCAFDSVGVKDGTCVRETRRGNFLLGRRGLIVERFPSGMEKHYL